MPQADVEHNTETVTTARPSASSFDEAAITAMLTADDDVTYPNPVLTDRSACPVFLAGAQLGRVVARHHALDCLDIKEGDRDRKNTIEQQMRRLDDAMDLLRSAIEVQQASSLEGALVQIVVANAAASDIIENSDLDGDGREKRVKAIRRCLYSIAKVLGETTDLSLRVFGADYLMASWCDEIGIAWNLPRETHYTPDKPTVGGRDDRSLSKGA